MNENHQEVFYLLPEWLGGAFGRGEGAGVISGIPGGDGKGAIAVGDPEIREHQKKLIPHFLCFSFVASFYFYVFQYLT